MFEGFLALFIFSLAFCANEDRGTSKDICVQETLGHTHLCLQPETDRERIRISTVFFSAVKPCSLFGLSSWLALSVCASASTMITMTTSLPDSLCLLHLIVLWSVTAL
ncbi:hypothetical protein Q7C36_015611 [Tachysurus vachellii]|uniref:Secreted protein n=1 Tax=Tachysurus vachellii TaxID=175792 RepID=A0AA88MAL3_TACVA|nr:hypothetical protein Q7C36_015611 [Tachysurus vachellii]